MSTDGAPAFRSVTKSVWPVYIFIGNIPPDRRFKERFILPVMCVPGNPKDLESFLRPLYDELEQIGAGISCKLWDGSTRLVRVHLMMQMSDLQARRKLCLLKGVNGYHPCWLCNMKGIRLRGRKTVYYPDFIWKSRGNRQIRKVLWNPARLCMRNDNDTHSAFETIRSARENGNHREADEIAMETGIVGMPEIVRRFDSVHAYRSFPVDLMHLLLENIAPFMVSIWTGDVDTEGDHCYLSSPAAMRKVDQILIDSGSGINDSLRRPRALSVRGMWKADEWRTFIDTTSLVALTDVLPTDILNGWKLFVDICELSFRPEVTSQDVERLSQLCLNFFRHFSDTYYGGRPERIHLMRFTIHLLLHISDSTISCGPLVCVSQFSVERQIGLMKAATHARHRYAESVVMRWTFAQALNICASKFNYDIPLLSGRNDSAVRENDRSLCSNRGRYVGFYVKGPREEMNIAQASEKFGISIRNRLIRYYEASLGFSRADVIAIVDGNDAVATWARLSVQREDEWSSSNYGQFVEGRARRSKSYIAAGFSSSRDSQSEVQEEMVGVSYGEVLCFMEHRFAHPRNSGEDEEHMLVLARWVSRGLRIGPQQQIYARGEKDRVFTMVTIEDASCILRNIAVMEGSRGDNRGQRRNRNRRTYFVDNRLQIDNLLGDGYDRAGAPKSRLQGLSQ